MVPWLVPLASSAISGFCSFFGGYLYGKNDKSTPSQVGVIDNPQQNHLIQIVNSTNIRLDSLADQHNDHKSQVEQFMLVGLLAVGVLFLLVLGIGCLGCCYCRRLQRKLKRQEAPGTFGSTMVSKV